MRIQINLDVAEHELGLATELLSVLRSITDEVTVRTQKGINGLTAAKSSQQAPHPSSGVSNAHSSSAPANATHQRSTSGGSASSVGHRVTAPGPSAASIGTALPPGFPPPSSKPNGSAAVKQPSSRPGSSGSQAGSQRGPRAPYAASSDLSSSTAYASATSGSPQLPAPKAGSAPGPAKVPSMPGPPSRENATAAANRPGPTPVSGEKVIAATRPNPPSRESIVAALRKLIEGLDTEDKYDVCLDKVAANLKTVFDSGNLGDGDEAEAFGRFWDAFRSILWDPQRLQAQKSVVPFMNLLPRLPEDILAKTKEPLISQTMRRLTESRPVDTPRQEFFTDAEIFACIVTFHLVAASGAVRTIIQMLGTEQKRAAAVTMLGKTVERCADQLITEVEKDDLAKLRETVDKIQEPIFQYDKSYVYDCMEWVTPASAPAAPASGTLLASTSYKGHSEAVYALAYDPTHSQLASAGKDSTIALWDSHGRLAQRLQSEQEGCYGGMSMHSSQPILAAACMGGGATPRVDIVDVGPGRLNRRCQLQRTSSDLVSCVAFLPGSELFAIGELLSGSEQGTVSIFDVNHLAEPVATLKDEHGTVTCVGALDTGSPNPNVMMSGAKDGTITVWDIRSQKPAIHLAVSDPADDSAMVTTFDSQNCLVLAGSLNNQICQWDVRRLQAGTNAPQEAKTLDGSAILRITFGPTAPQAAVSTMGGLYYGDPFAEGVQPSSMQVSPLADREQQNYPDVKWGKGNDADALYAASLDGSIDVYRLS